MYGGEVMTFSKNCTFTIALSYLRHKNHILFNIKGLVNGLIYSYASYFRHKQKKWAGIYVLFKYLQDSC